MIGGGGRRTSAGNIIIDSLCNIKLRNLILSSLGIIFILYYYLLRAAQPSSHQMTKMSSSFTSVASTAFNMPRVGLGTLGLNPMEAKTTINGMAILFHNLCVLMSKISRIITFISSCKQFVTPKKRCLSVIGSSIVHRFTLTRKK